MDSFIVRFVFIILMISVAIYLANNHEILIDKYEKNKDKKVVKIISMLGIGLVFLILLIMICNATGKLYLNLSNLDVYRENELLFDNVDEQLSNEEKNYNELINKEYENKSNSPYIPEGFEYKEGNVETGFVIVDSIGNEYVWVPCFNKEIGNVPKLEKQNFTNEPFIYADMCINENSEKFIKSALENGGYYISRYELGKENEKLVSKKGIKIEKDILIDDVKTLVNKLNEENVNYNLEMINGFAYDTALRWIMNTNGIKLEYYDVNQEIISGRNEYNKINDFFDNIMEYTSENEYGAPIIRGFPFDEYHNEKENVIINFDRLSIKKDKSTFSAGTKIGIRTIIYK